MVLDVPATEAADQFPEFDDLQPVLSADIIALITSSIMPSGPVC
jgi:hypothetical protein